MTNFAPGGNTLPPPRMRVRTTPPWPRELIPTPVKHWRAPYNVPETMTREECLELGEVDVNKPPASWQGWPNGSATFDANGRYKGRGLVTPSGRCHMLRWNAHRGCHIYMRLASSRVAGTMFL